MKTINIKSLLQVLLLTAVIITSVIVSRTIYRNIKEVCMLQPAGAGTNCFFDVMNY